MLNNQPMGFYHPATLVKDAQRHGLKVKPIDVTCSDWLCTLEKNGQRLCRSALGMRYVKGLREEVAQEIVRQRALRPFRFDRRFETARARLAKIRIDGAGRNWRFEFYRIAAAPSRKRQKAARIAATPCGKSSARRAAPVPCSRNIVNWDSIQNRCRKPCGLAQVHLCCP